MARVKLVSVLSLTWIFQQFLIKLERSQLKNKDIGVAPLQKPCFIKAIFNNFVTKVLWK